MDKRGQGLPLNVIVIAIIVVVALVVLLAFFLGAFGNLGSRAGTTAGTALEGTELGLAVASCENLCNQAKALPNALKPQSAYCTKEFNVGTKDSPDIKKCGSKSLAETRLPLGVECLDERGNSVCEIKTTVPKK